MKKISSNCKAHTLVANFLLYKPFLAVSINQSFRVQSATKKIDFFFTHLNVHIYLETHKTM